MELIDRYLQAVRFWLPKPLRQDIIAELAEEIRSQIEDKELELGRKLNGLDLEAILMRLGRPMMVASRYLPHQYLMGPGWFRIFRLILKWAMLPVTVAIVLIAVPVGILAPAYEPELFSFFIITFYAIGIIVTIALIMEKYRNSFPFGVLWAPGFLRSVGNYLKAVQPLLPDGQKQDIIAELGEDLWSQIDDQTARLGRPPSKSELADILKRRGHPISVAESFLPQQHLIGPAWFPAYSFALKTTLLRILLPVWLIIVGPAIALKAGNLAIDLLAAIWQLSIVVFYLVGVFTMVFALLEHTHVKFAVLDRWKPRSLPQLVTSSHQDPKWYERPIPRWQSISGLVAWGIASIWWLALPHYPDLLFGPAAGSLKFAPAWQTIYWPVAILLLMGLAQRVVDLLYSHWNWLLPLVRLVANTVGLAIVYFFFKSYPFVVTASQGSNSEHAARVFDRMLYGFLIWLPCFLLINAIINAVRLILVTRPLIRRGRAPTAIGVS